MRPETEEKLNKAVELVRQGSAKTAALKAAGIKPAGLYFKQLNQMLGAKPKKMKFRKQKRPAFIDLPLKEESKNVAVIVCSPDQLRSVIEGL